MRVMQLMAGAEHGGAEAFFERLAGGLHRGGVEQKVVIRKDAARAERLIGEGVTPVQLPFGGMFDFCTPFALKKIARDFKPDVVLSWMNRASRMTPPGPFVRVARLGGYYDLKYYKRCDHLVGNTRDIVDYLVREGWPAERAHYLPNFVTIDAAPPLSRDVFSTPTGAPLLLTMGRLHKNKAFDVMLEAMAKLDNCYLWIAGEGPERAALEAQARHLGVGPRVRFLGWRSDIAALLAACDIYVCPSRHEPLGNVVLEAWASGKPVVAAASQGPSALIRDGENGMLAALEDAEGLANGVSRLLGDPVLAASVAQAGNASYRDDYTEEAVVRHYLDFFTRIVEAR